MASNETTTLYLHGGAFIFGGIPLSRHAAGKLSEASEGRVLVVDYQLAPQNPFPTPLLDLLVVYLSLLYPPPGSQDPPISASSIVLAGDSSGANICLAFIQLVRQIDASANANVRFNGVTVRVPMPAGVTMVSIPGDYTQAHLPSWKSNSPYDIWSDESPFSKADFPEDHIWPSKSPRRDPYCSIANMVHPLVSLCLSESWEGAPPIWMAIGQEQMLDSAAMIARKAMEDGVTVIWVQFEFMPHSWPTMLPRLPQTAHCFNLWGKMCRTMVQERTSLTSRGSWIAVEDCKETEIDMDQLPKIELEKARDMMVQKAARRLVKQRSKSQASKL